MACATMHGNHMLSRVHMLHCIGQPNDTMHGGHTLPRQRTLHCMWQQGSALCAPLAHVLAMHDTALLPSASQRVLL